MVGPLKMDHHGEYSDLQGVAIRAHSPAMFGNNSQDYKFVVTGSADADAVAAIVGLSGIHRISSAEVELINKVDTDPISVGSLLDYGIEGLKLLAFNQATSGMPNGLDALWKAIEIFVDIYSRDISLTESVLVRRGEERRVFDLTSSALRVWDHGEGSPVALACNPMWGFDVWYQKAPIVVSFVEVKQSITIGVVSTEKAEELLGEGGLKNVFPILDEKLDKSGWGGRETIGGSPRNVEMTIDEARTIVRIIGEFISSR